MIAVFDSHFLQIYDREMTCFKCTQWMYSSQGNPSDHFSKKKFNSDCGFRGDF